MKLRFVVPLAAVIATSGASAFARSVAGATLQQSPTTKAMDQRSKRMSTMPMPNSYAQLSAAHEHARSGNDSLAIPRPLQVEHEELHSHLAQLTKAGGRTGEAAQKLAEVLDPHFQKENEYALPPLGLLVPLSEGKFECGMTAVLQLTDKLRAEMPTMFAEHKDIAAGLAQLRNAAISENNSAGVQFADHLAAHAQTEEQITYPTALLIGLYVESKSAQCAR